MFRVYCLYNHNVRRGLLGAMPGVRHARLCRAGQGRVGQSRAAYRDLAVCSLNGDVLLQSPAILVSSVFELAIGSGQLQRSGRREKR